MKGSNSRFSHRPAERFSNLAQVQGGMVTDADLTEAGQIHQARDETLGVMALASGVPAEGGMVALTGGLPSIREGLVVAGGKAGRFTLTGAAATIKAAVAAQTDLPSGPALTDDPVLLYADLWDRPVFPIEDQALTDAGLHGAVTSYRTRTMVQVKAHPLAADADPASTLSALAAGTYPFLAKGDAIATLTPRTLTIPEDDCDPCATEVNVIQTVPNALFRIEVIAVTRSGGGAVQSVTLAWSMENAEAMETVAALADQTTRDAFARSPAVYEFLNDATEAQAGAFPGSFTALRPAFATSLTSTPSGTPAYTLVRRWDGSATATLNGAVSGGIGSGTLTVQQAKAVLAHEFFTLTLDFTGRQTIPGDYWLVELRRHAATADQVRLVGTDPAGQALPHGIEHRYCPLFVTRGNTAVTPDDPTRRRLSMPPLSDLPATHVSYDPACPGWYGPVETVAEALDAICNLSATKITYDSACEDWYGPVGTVAEALDALCHLPADKIAFTPDATCTRFAGATNVAEALERLCHVEDSTALTLVLRSMMDWGVICGLKLSRGREPGAIAWTAGVALDPAGRIAEVPAGEINLNAEKIDGLRDAAAIQKKYGEVCFALSFAEDGKLILHLTDPDTAKGPADPTRAEALEACNNGKKGLAEGITLKGLSKSRAELLRKVNLSWSNRSTLEGTISLSATDEAELNAVADGMLADYAKLISTGEAEEIKAIWATADAEYSTAGLTSAAADKRRMQRAVAKMATLEKYEKAFLINCDCATAHTPCAPGPAKPALVPLGCVTLSSNDPGNITITAICNFCCRRQAMTWRSYRYYNGSFIDPLFARLEPGCCARPKPPEPGGFDGVLDEWWKENPPVILDPGEKMPPYKVDLNWPPRAGIKIPGKGNIDPLPDELKNIRPDIKTFGVKDATDILTGNGFDVVQVLDLDEGGFDTVTTLAGKEPAPLRFDALPEPGDRVVLLMQGGKAADFVTIGKGDGRLPFSTKSDEAALDAKITAAIAAAVKDRPQTGAAPDLSDLTAQLKDLDEGKARIETEVTALDATRAGLAADIAGLSQNLGQLHAERAAAGASLASLRAEQDAALKGIAEAREALAELGRAQETMLGDVRGAQPVESLKLEPDVTLRLKEAGVVTVKDIEGLKAPDLTRVLRGTALNPTGLRDIMTGFIKPR